MGWWERNVVPRLVDATCGNSEVGRYRALACAGLQGRVLEVGFGSGLNVAHYPPEVTEVVAVEPSDLAWRMAQRRLTGAPVVRGGLDGQRLQEPDESVDAVLSTFTMCTIPDLPAALREARRVLRPGGSLHFLEHGRSPDARVARWQRRLEPVQRRVAGGCHLTRDPVAALEAAGLEVTACSTEYFPGPKALRPLGYVYRGRARKAAPERAT